MVSWQSDKDQNSSMRVARLSAREDLYYYYQGCLVANSGEWGMETRNLLGKIQLECLFFSQLFDQTFQWHPIAFPYTLECQCRLLPSLSNSCTYPTRRTNQEAQIRDSFGMFFHRQVGTGQIQRGLKAPQVLVNVRVHIIA